MNDTVVIGKFDDEGGKTLAMANIDKKYNDITVEQFDKIKSYIKTLLITKKERRKQ